MSSGERGQLNSSASWHAMRIFVRGFALALQPAIFCSAIEANPAFNSTPITLRKANSAASNKVRPFPAPTSTKVYASKRDADEESVSRQRRHASRKTDGATAE